MNGDGLDDLVLPPPRVGKTHHPTIYLSDGKGGFSYWSDAKWNPEVGFDYGDVKVGDFDQDGFLDIVLAIHFKNQYILYGSENHEFRRFKKLPSPDPRVTSRATTVADFDGDGRLDVAFLAELDLDLGESKRVKGTPTIWIVRNTESGWKLDSDYPTQFVIGDVLRSADMDGDGRQDLILSSNTSAWRAIVFFNRVDARWSTIDERRFESAMLRALGVRRRTVLSGVLAEFAALGFAAGLLASAGASILAAIVAIQLFELDYTFNLTLWVAGLLGGIMLVCISGFVSARGAINAPPADVLRAA